MKINKIIIAASLAAVIISGSAVIVQAVHNSSKKENTGAVTAAEIEMEIQNKMAADAKIAELRGLADVGEEYNLFKEYYDSTTDVNSTVAELRAALNSDIEALTAASQSCGDSINAVDADRTSQTQRRAAAEDLANEQCFADLQAALNKCSEDKTSVEAAIEEYNAQKAKEAEQRRLEQEKKKQQSSSSGSGGSKSYSNSSGKSSGSSGGSSSGGGSKSAGSGSSSSGSSGGSTSGSAGGTQNIPVYQAPQNQGNTYAGGSSAEIAK